MSDVFTLSGVPTVTFVEPVEYSRLKVALEARGRGIVIEGPSGIGKTTAVRRAIEELGIKGKVTELSARKLRDVEVIEALPDLPDAGIVVVDDFHRLPGHISLKVADYLKTLADESIETTKLVILGINKAGESLISFGRDVAARMEVIRFQREPDDHLREVIRLGEAALNITIPISDEIVTASNGSFNLVQFLCHDACLSKDFALSFAGADRDVAEALFDRLTDNELEVFYDKNEQSRILAENVEEYLGPIYRTEASFVVCLLGPDYPNKVWTKFESDAFKSRFGTNDVIPVWFASAAPGMFDESRKVGGLSFDRSKNFDDQVTYIVEELSKKIADRRLAAAHVARDDLEAPVEVDGK